MVDFHWGFETYAEADSLAAAIAMLRNRPEIVLLRLSNLATRAPPSPSRRAPCSKLIRPADPSRWRRRQQVMFLRSCRRRASGPKRAFGNSSSPTSATRTRAGPTAAPLANSSPGASSAASPRSRRRAGACRRLGRSADPGLSAPTVKQRLAAIRMLFDWLVTGQIVPINPAATVRGPRHVVKSARRRCSIRPRRARCSTASTRRRLSACATAR